MEKEKKGVGINPISQIHYIDHLAVVCDIMGIPLIFTEPSDRALAQKYYPDLETLYVDHQELNPEYLIAHYDVLYMSDLFDRYSFREKYLPYEKKYQKTIRHVHCPHGFSDKGFYLKASADEDIVLIYGQNMLDLLKYHEVLDKLNQYILTGNIRYTYFKKHKIFFDSIVEKEVLSQFAKKQPIILYAPTWLDRQDSSTFFDAHKEIIGNLPEHYNMIVKLHPRLEDEAAEYYHILSQYEKKTNVLFLKDFPLVYPLLAHSDIYIGDTSSVGYDFLVFNKPMFFLNKLKRNPRTDRSLYLFRCGLDIKPDAYPLLYQFIEVNLTTDKERFSDIRSQVYDYTFVKERSFADIKADITKCINTK